MNIKESSLREMCERDREFCDLLTFRSGWGNGPDMGIVIFFFRTELNGATFQQVL